MSTRRISILMFLTAFAAWDDAIVTASVPPQGTASDLAASLARPVETAPDGRRTGCRTLNDRTSFSPPDTVEAWRTRADLVRRRVLVAAGLWPLPERTPLAPVIHGRVARDDYSVEKVHFESSPGFLVTGNLYRPVGRGDGPHAAVLSPHGHFANGRFCERSDTEVERQLAEGWETSAAAARYHIQARCVQLARMGCVVFHYDMVGYADSRQLAHGAGFGDAASELWGRSAFGVQTWNSIRALDFLAGLPDVDPDRIGVTGASGGGTQTFILCAIDDRPAAAFPAVMVSTGMQGGCVCENASHLRVGTNNVELAALFAPKPLALTGANDWTIGIETDGYPALKEVYRMLGKPENVFAKCYPTFEHNYNRHSRELMYAWFNRHLDLGQPVPIREREFIPLSPTALSVFDAEHPAPSTGYRHFSVRPAGGRTLDETTPRWWNDEAEYRAVVGGALEVMVASALPAPEEVDVIATTDARRGDLQVRELVLARGGAEEAVAALLLTPPEWNGEVVVSVLAGGRAELLAARDDNAVEEAFDLHAALLDRGFALLLPEVLLAGKEDGRLPVHEGRHAQFVGYTWGYNRTLLAERVHDVLTTLGFAAGLDGTKEIHLLGLGDSGPWVLLARALARDAVGRTAASWSSSFDAEMTLDDPNFLPGIRKYGDLAMLATRCAPGELYLVGDLVSARIAHLYGDLPAVDGPVSVAPTANMALVEWLAR